MTLRLRLQMQRAWWPCLFYTLSVDVCSIVQQPVENSRTLKLLRLHTVTNSRTKYLFTIDFISGKSSAGIGVDDGI